MSIYLKLKYKENYILYFDFITLLSKIKTEWPTYC